MIIVVEGPTAAGPLHDWYDALSRLDARRVRWELPAAGLPRPGTLAPRRPRTGKRIFDALIGQLRAGREGGQRHIETHPWR